MFIVVMVTYMKDNNDAKRLHANYGAKTDSPFQA